MSLNNFISKHWISSFKAPKGEGLLDYSCSAYAYNEVIRFCFSCSKQKYYFELPQELFNTLTDIEAISSNYFQTDRNNCHVAKCVRCSKWDVEKTEIFCPRCLNALDSPLQGNTEIDVVI